MATPEVEKEEVVEEESAEGSPELEEEQQPSTGGATGQITPLSVIAALRGLVAPLRVGT